VSRSAVLLGLVVVACRAATGDTDGHLSARVGYSPRDSVRFETPAWLRRCGGARGFVLEGEVRGNGVLVWLRPGESLPSGRYPVLTRGDTLTPRGAVVAARFMTRDIAHGVVLDSGWVTVKANRGTGVEGERLQVSAEVGGAGLEIAGGRRVRVEAEFDQTTPAADSARCEARP